MRFNLNKVPANFVALAVLLLSGVLALAVVGCGGGDATEVPTVPERVTQLTGDISIDGSSTVFPITEAMAEEFGNATDGNVRITVGVSGTGGGFKKFCSGETVISDASRPIKQSEVNLCAENDIEYVEIPVAIDGLSIMVNPENDFVECMTIDELNTIWKPEAEEGEAEEVTKWSQVRDGWPDEDIRLYGPGTDSGTFDYFTEVVSGEGGASRGDFLPSEDDNVLVTGISGDQGGLGYFGYAYYTENADRLKLLSIDGGSGCITPTEETINNGTYSPLSRPLFIYVSADALNEEHIRAFVEFYLDSANRNLISETGYIPFPDNVYELALSKFLSAMTGAALARHPRSAADVHGDDGSPGHDGSLEGNIDIDGSNGIPHHRGHGRGIRQRHRRQSQDHRGCVGHRRWLQEVLRRRTIISDASRPIEQSEVDLCLYIELPVAIDGLSVMVNPANTSSSV